MKKLSVLFGLLSVLYTASLTPCLAQSVSPYEAYVTVPFYTRSDADFTIAQTYYVAPQDPNASSTNDGLLPTSQGNGHGPFRALADLAPVLALPSPGGTKVVLRHGLYVVGGTFGLVLPGGTDEFTPFILAGYPGETAILDGTGLHTVVVLDQTYTILENLTIRNASKYNVRVGGH